jgi:peptide/nickel transport system substrate-binding protein
MSRRSLVVVAVGALAVLASLAVAGPKKVHENELRDDKPWVQDKADEATAKQGGTVVLGLLGEPDSLNPYLTTTADVDELLRLVYPQLMKEGVDYANHPPEFLPYFAESHEFSADRKTITYHLRKDMNWSDGVPVSADDVRYSWQTAKDKDVAWSGNSIKDFIDRVDVIDPKTVALHFTDVYPYQEMDSNDGYIIPKHVFEKVKYADWKTYPSWTETAKISAGPYRVKEYVPQQFVTLEPNPTYYRKGFPHVGTVTFRIIKNQQAMFDAFMSGGVDVLQTVRPNDAKRILDDGRFRLMNCASRAFSYIGWNCTKWPFDDPEVRRALTLASDREGIVESILLGYGDVASAPIISSMWAHDASIKPWPYDLDEAAKVLESRGWKKGSKGIYEKDGKALAFTLSTAVENQLAVRACTLLQANWKEFGADVKIEQAESNLLTERYRKHEFEAYRGAWAVATKIDEKPTWHSQSRGYDGFNWVNYSNPRVDEIIDKARVLSDFAAAKPLWAELQAILHKEQPYTFLAEPRQLNAYPKRLRNVISASTSPYYNLEEWWWEGKDSK